MNPQTSPAPRTVRRAAGRATLLLGAGMAALVLLAQPASADVPENWSDPDEVSTLHALLLLGGIPLLLMLLITLAVYVPALARGERLAPGAAPIDDEWFGGPRSDTGELAGRSAAPQDATDDRRTGGASGSW